MDTDDILQTLPAGAMAPADGEPSTDSKITTQVDPVPPVAADAPLASLPATEPAMLDQIEHVVEEVEQAVVNAVHTIEHRCFGRPTADHPVVVITHTGN